MPRGRPPRGRDQRRLQAAASPRCRSRAPTHRPPPESSTWLDSPQDGVYRLAAEPESSPSPRRKERGERLSFVPLSPESRRRCVCCVVDLDCRFERFRFVGPPSDRPETFVPPPRYERSDRTCDRWGILRRFACPVRGRACTQMPGPGIRTSARRHEMQRTHTSSAGPVTRANTVAAAGAVGEKRKLSRLPRKPGDVARRTLKDCVME